MSKQSYTILSVLVCDDVRTEMNRKQSVYGLYDEELIAGTFPALVMKLCFRIAVHVPKGQPKRFKFSFASPTNKIAEIEHEFPKFVGTGRTLALTLAPTPVIFPGPDAYSISLGIDGPAKKIGQLIVRAPIGKEEKNRLALK